MSKESKIAKENIKVWKERINKTIMMIVCEEHKQTCQRRLEFLSSLRFVYTPPCPSCKINYDTELNVDDKRIDLKQAIKLYDDAGV